MIAAGVGLVILLGYFAGTSFNKPQPAAETLNLTGAVRAPDISQLSPEEQAGRLFSRVMLLSGQGKSDSVLFFAPMAIGAYQMMSPLSARHRYEIGRIAQVSGAFPLAAAQADTILREDPNHLLGLILAAGTASLAGDSARRRSYEARILTAYDAESARRRPEYERHSADIAAALSDARRSTGAAR